MSKQTKQLIALVAIVVVGGGAVVYLNFFKDKPPATPAANNAPAVAPDPAPAPTPPPVGGATAAGPVGGPAPLSSTEALPMPKEDKPTTLSFTWKFPVVEKGLTLGSFHHDPKKRIPGAEYPFDPMHVMNLDVVAPERRLYIDRIRNEWVIEGVTVTPQMVLRLNDKGEPDLDENGNKVWEKKQVPEAWFKGKRRPYKTGDRLTGTRFTVEEIILTRAKTSVKLRGDNQEELELELAIPGRYPD
ncbi:MAG: hypothetical protein KF754_04610 [Planctomycetes bacterium]|nr:hypothetical protein [Planctomycetota bacterium]